MFVCVSEKFSSGQGLPCGYLTSSNMVALQKLTPAQPPLDAAVLAPLHAALARLIVAYTVCIEPHVLHPRDAVRLLRLVATGAKLHDMDAGAWAQKAAQEFELHTSTAEHEHGASGQSVHRWQLASPLTSADMLGADGERVLEAGASADGSNNTWKPEDHEAAVSAGERLLRASLQVRALVHLTSQLVCREALL